jgi:hypothetical protein
MALVPDILNAAWLKERYLVGIDLTDDSGAEYPDELYNHSLKAAIAVLEGVLGIRIRETREFEERQDVLYDEDVGYFLSTLDRRPVREVRALQVQYANFPPTDLPLSWLHVVSETHGQVQIIPGAEAFAGVVFSNAGAIWPTTLMTARRYTPQWVKYTYTAGFDWTDPEQADEALLMGIGIFAAALPLDTAGDLIAGAGIANKSISFDGLSQTLGTTSSATNSGYGAKLQSQAKRYKEQVLPALKARYKLLEMAVF